MSLVCLRIYVSEAARHRGQLAWEWLLDEARRMHIGGGSAFRAVAGFGRHGRHDEGFFELAGELPIVVEFLVEPAAADALLARVGEARLGLFYVRLPAETGFTD